MSQNALVHSRHAVCTPVRIEGMSIEDWVSQDPKNIYVGDGTKWGGATPFDRETYVRDLFSRQLYLRFDGVVRWKPWVYRCR